jgi:hypothetical protein
MIKRSRILTAKVLPRQLGIVQVAAAIAETAVVAEEAVQVVADAVAAVAAEEVAAVAADVTAAVAMEDTAGTEAAGTRVVNHRMRKIFA